MEIERTKGCRGVVRLPYEIVPGENCVGGKHFTIAGKPEVIFEDKQYKAIIEVDKYIYALVFVINFTNLTVNMV